MNEQEKKSRRNIITTLINQLVATACGIVVPKILISSFGSAAYGISVSIAQFLSYITLLEGGIGGVARAKLYGPLAQGDRHAISVVYHSVKHFFYYVAAAFLLYSVALGLLYHDLAHVTVLSRAYTFCLVLVISLTTLAKYVGGLANLTLLTADQKQYVNNYISIGTTVVNTAFIIALARSGYGLLWVKLGSSLVFLIRPALYAVYVRKHYWLPKTGRDKAVLDQKWTGIGQHIAYFLHRNTDVVLLTLFSDVRLVAVYSVYNLIISSIRAIAEAVSGGMEATFGELLASGKHDKLICAYKQYKVLLSAASVSLFCCTGILIVPFVRLYTQGVTDADYIQPLFAIVLIAVEAINCLVLPCASLPIAADQMRQTRWGAYGEALINITVSCALMRWQPMLGVAFGTLAATVFRGLYYMVYSSRTILHISPRGNIFALAGILATMCAGIYVGCYFVGRLEIDSYFRWVICGAVTFGIICVPVGIVSYFCIKRRI